MSIATGPIKIDGTDWWYWVDSAQTIHFVNDKTADDYTCPLKNLPWALETAKRRVQHGNG